ncbi:branched-chain amino acid ABC transporter permease [Candidatus Woesearchaeota archaeon]|nr:branched-chain amino acid ABC transporter permease [Candidatus Woesearchaeota archaeon]
MIEQYLIHLLILFGIYLILSLALNLNAGYTGLINFSIISFFGIGAYTFVLLISNGFYFISSLIFVVILSLIASFVLNFFTKNLKKDYFATASLAFSFLVYSIFLNFVFLTKGPYGISITKTIFIFGFPIYSSIHYLLMIWIAVILFVVVLVLLKKSNILSFFIALKNNENKLKTLGKNTSTIRFYSLAISAIFSALAGAFFAVYVSYIHPSQFTLTEFVIILTMVIIGGVGSFRGTAIGVIFVIFLTEGIRFLNISNTIIGPLRQIMYSSILIILLLYNKKGFFGKMDFD